MPFDTAIPSTTGEFTEFRVIDPDSNPNTVLEIGRTWGFHVTWRVTGPGVPVMGGTWYVQAFLDPLTVGGAPIAVYSGNFPLSANGALIPPFSWVWWDRVTGLPAQPAGLYKVFLVVNYRNILGRRQPMAGYYEGPIVEFYQP